MQFNESIKPLIVIVGPTAVGKTDFSIALASQFDGEIISADSRLFYLGMDIGTAKPSVVERSCVPHFMIDIADPAETVDLAHYQEMVHASIPGIYQRGHLPFLVGGTGQYIKAITEGWRIPSQAPNHELRRVLSNWAATLGGFELHKRLQSIDPEAAAIIEWQNIRRTIRALEVIFSTGEKFSRLRAKTVPPYRFLTIGLMRPRDELYHRVDVRIDQMMRNGLIDEVKGLLQAGYAPDLPAFSAIGYKEIIQFLENEISLEEAIVLIKRKTRVFVRRQANWFKENDPDIHWMDMDTDVMQTARNLIEQFLSAL